MHSHSRRPTAFSATISVLLAAAVIVPGCRGNKPFGRFVKVTQESQSDLPYVDAPQQRLATSRSQGASKVTHGGTEVTMTTEPVDQRASAVARDAVASRQGSAINQLSSNQPVTNVNRRTLQQDLVNRKEVVRRDDSSRDIVRPAKQAVTGTQKTLLASNKTQTKSNDRALVAKPGQPKPDAQHSELLDAFADYPPEVQREALRRLVAATSKSAQRTEQPSGFESELQKQAQHLPELPAAKNSAADVPATRLGTRQPPKARQSSAVVTVADHQRPHTKKPSPKLEPKSDQAEASGRELLAEQQKAAQQKIAAMNSRISDLATGVIEPGKTTDLASQTSDPALNANDLALPAAATGPVVASIGDMEKEGDPGSVQPVSATRPAGAPDDMIARAAPDNKIADNKIADPKVSGVPGDVDALSDQQLYHALVKQLSTAPADESDAQRSSRLIKLRHLMVLSGDVDSAVKKIEGMSESEQEFLRHQLLGLWTMVDPSGHPVASRRITTALPQLRQATQFAAAATDSLEVRSVSFCSEIESYGQIKPFKSNRFDAGQQVILYCEIENFSAKKSDEGYVTEMQGSYDIFNANNQKVVSQLLPADRQVSSNYLRDYYIAYQMHLPKQLPAGKYRMQLTMEDVSGKKYGQSSVELEIK